jgi:hypothetical protein
VLHNNLFIRKLDRGLAFMVFLRAPEGKPFRTR